MLPGGSSRVGDNLFVRRENSKTVFKGLADQHAVKWIFVVIGQGRLVQRVGFLQGQFFNIQPKKGAGIEQQIHSACVKGSSG